MPSNRNVYIPGKRKSELKHPIAPEIEYRKYLVKGKPILAGTVVILPYAKDKSLHKLGISFNPDGTVSIPFYEGQDAGVHRVGVRVVKSIPQCVRMVHHQIDSVKTRSIQARLIHSEISRLHWDLNHKWPKFSQEQKSSFTQYFFQLIGNLTKNPVFLRDPNKIHAAERFVTTVKLLNTGNDSAAAATMVGIAHNMMNWSRKMTLQLPRLERRMNMVVWKKFEMDTKIFFSVDALRLIYNQISSGVEKKSVGILNNRLVKVERDLESTGLTAFKVQAKNVSMAVDLLAAGDFKKAQNLVKTANKGIIIEASKMSSIYPDKLSEIRKSKDQEFKTAVLSNQVALFGDMMHLWWQPKNRDKSEIIIDSVGEMSKLAESLGKKDAPKLFEAAILSLKGNSVENFSMCFDAIADLLKSQK